MLQCLRACCSYVLLLILKFHFILSEGFKVIPALVAIKSVLLPTFQGWGRGGRHGHGGVEGRFQCVLSGSCVYATEFENYRFGTQIFISTLWLSCNLKVILKVRFPGFPERGGAEPLIILLCSLLSDCVALGKSCRTILECVTVSLSVKNKVIAFPGWLLSCLCPVEVWWFCNSYLRMAKRHECPNDLMRRSHEPQNSLPVEAA